MQEVINNVETDEQRREEYADDILRMLQPQQASAADEHLVYFAESYAIDRRMEDTNGIGRDVIELWRNSKDRASVEKLFSFFTGISFPEYLAKSHQDIKKKATGLNNEKAFVYNGYHFIPVRSLPKESSFMEISKHLVRDPFLGFNRYGSFSNWDHNEFYNASTNKEADIFLCVETEKEYLPGDNELFLWEE